MNSEKKNKTYEKPEAEVIKLEKDVNFMTASIIVSGGEAQGFEP